MIERRDWRPEDVIGLVLRVLIAFVLAGLVQSLVLPVAGGSAGEPGPRAWLALVAGQVCLHGALLVSMRGFLRKHRLGWSEGFGLRVGGCARAIGTGILAGLAFLPAAYGLQWAVGSWLKSLGVDMPSQAAIRVLTEADLVGRSAIFVTAALVAPWVEEMLFRGVLYPFVRDLGWPRLALWGTALAFGLVHANRSVFVPLTVFGYLLGLLYRHSGNLLVPVAAHVTFNTAPFVLLALGIRVDA